MINPNHTKPTEEDIFMNQFIDLDESEDDVDQDYNSNHVLSIDKPIKIGIAASLFLGAIACLIIGCLYMFVNHLILLF